MERKRDYKFPARCVPRERGAEGRSFPCEEGNRMCLLSGGKLGSVMESLQNNQTMSRGRERSHLRETIGQFLGNVVSVKPEKCRHACQQVILTRSALAQRNQCKPQRNGSMWREQHSSHMANEKAAARAVTHPGTGCPGTCWLCSLCGSLTRPVS